MPPRVTHWPADEPAPDEDEIRRRLLMEGLGLEETALDPASGRPQASGGVLRETWWLVRGDVDVRSPEGFEMTMRAGDRLDLPPGERVEFAPREGEAFLLRGVGSGGQT